MSLMVSLDLKLKNLERSTGSNRANTRRMNRLEELGRVDAEKAFTKKGARNLKDEKKRIVRELKAEGGKVSRKMGRAAQQKSKPQLDEKKGRNYRQHKSYDAPPSKITRAGKKDGGSLKPVNPKTQKGLSKLPTEVRNKMGYMKKGGKVNGK